MSDANYTAPAFITTNPVSSGTTLNFYLSALDSSVGITKALITAVNDGSDNLPIQAKAVAELMVDASSVRSVFQFATNSAELTDVNAEDLYFFVDAAGFADLPVNTGSWAVGAQAGTVSGKLSQQIGSAFVSGIKTGANNYDLDVKGSKYEVDNKGLIKDLFRDLAHQLFKTQYGVDIFNNEQDLCNNTAASLAALFVAPVHPVTSNIFKVLNDASGMSQSNQTANNIGRVIFESIVLNDSSRLQDLSGGTTIYVSTGSLDASGNPTVGSGTHAMNTEMREYKMPLLPGDKLHFHVACNFDAAQAAVVGLPSLTNASRWYEIILNLQ